MNLTRKRMFKKGFLSFVAALLMTQMLVVGYGGRGVVHADSVSSGIPLKPLTSMVPGKARFAPGETAALTIQFNNESTWHGNLHVQIYQLDTLIAEGTRGITVLKDTDSALDIQWLPPQTDFRGYMAKAWIEGAAADDFVTAAIDVSSDWTHFPRYGYVTEFPKETSAESDAKLKQLSQEYYLNAYQFYDWMWRHDVSVYSKTDADGKPLRDANGNFITAPIDANTSYTDLLGRSLYPQTIKQEVAAAQKYGSSAMAYEMNYAARENYQDFGVKPEWGLYNKTAPTPPDPQKDQVGFFFDGVKPHPTALYLQDPGNPEWQSYITKEFVRAVKDFGFDGIHLDQWGAADNDYLLDHAGQKRYFSLDFDKIINATKDALNANTGSKNHVTFNMVGGNGGYSAVPNPNTKTDFDYSEIWQDKNRYGDLKQVVDDTRSKDGGKAMVIAGYMNYKQATGIGYDASAAQDVPHTVVFQSRINRAPSWVGDFGKKDEDKIIFTVTAPEAGNYDLTFHYGHGNDGGNPEGYVTVNGAVAADSVPFDQKTGWGNPVATRKLSNVQLKAGENKIMLQLHSNDLWLNLQSLDVAGQGVSRQYQAVFAELISCKVDQYGNVYYFETDGDYVTFHVNASSEGDYPIAFSYSVASETVKRNVYVNGTKTGEWTFPSTGGWETYRESSPSTVHLKAGDNTVTLKDEGFNDTGMKLQYLSFNGDRYMAENADIGWAPTQPAMITKVPGTIAAQYAQNIIKGPHFIEFTVHSDETAVKQALFSYGTLNTVHGLLQVNGSAGTPITFDSTGGWGGENKLALKPVNLDLHAGDDNAVRLTLDNEDNYMNLDGLYTGGQQILVNDSGKVTLTGSVKVNPSADKDAKTDDFNSSAGSVTFSVESAQERQAVLRIWYRTGNNVSANVTVTGDVYAVSLPSNDWYGNNWWGYVDTPVQLHAGDNTVSVQVKDANTYLNLHGIALLDPAEKIEAEAATDKNGVDNGGAFTDGFGGAYDTVTFPVSSSAEGTFPVTFRYKSTEALDYQLYVGSGAAPVSLHFDDSNGAWAEQTFDVYLPAGNSTLKLQPAKDLTSSILLDNIEVEGTTTEAEDASVKLTGGANIQSDAAEVGYIGNFKQKGDYVQFAFGQANDSGETVLKVNYKNEDGPVERTVYVNGRKAGTLELPHTDSDWGSASLPVYVQSSDSANTIMVKKEDEQAESGIQIDNVEMLGFKLEAENAETGWQPVVPRTGSIASTFGKTDDFGQPGQAVTFDVNVSEAVDRFDVLYHTGNNPAMTVSVDGTAVAENVVFPSTNGGWDGPDVAKTIKAAIPAGQHTVTLTMTSGGQYMNLAGLAIGEDRYVVADADLTAGGGNAVQTSIGYAGDFKDDGDFVTFSVKVPAAGEYDLGWKYRNDAVSQRTAVRAVVVNGSAAQTVSFPSNESWSYVTMNNVHLNQGLNEVTISVSGSDDDGIKLDHLKASSAAGFSKIYEAEYADFLPPMTLYKDTILNFGHYGDTVSFDVDVPQAGETSLIYTYSNPGSFTSRAVYIDGMRTLDLGGNPARIGFDGTGNKESYSEDGYFIVPYLSKGTHRVTLKFDEASEKGSIQIRRLTLGYFNEPSLRLMDAGLAAMGATHIELGTAEKLSDGPNMLAHEYYPNRSKKVLDSTKESMKEYYKFYAGYENLLFDSREDTSASLQVKQDGIGLPVSTDGKQNTVWYTVRKNGDNPGFERYDVVHLINLLNNDSDWRNAAQGPTVQTDLQITYPIGITKDEAPNLKVYAASPDAGHGMSEALEYVWNGTDLVIDLPSLQYWSMIYIDKNPQTVPVQTLTIGSAGQDNPQQGSGGHDPGQNRPQGTIVLGAADLKPSADGKVVVKLDGESGNDIRIPTAAIESLKDNPLVVQGERFSLQLDPRTIRQLLDANRDQLDANAEIQLNIRTMEGGQGVPPAGDGMKLTGPVYELELGVKTKDGSMAKLSSFETPVRFSQSYVADAEQADFLGVYYFNESTKAWEYIGGKIDRNGKTITADLPHFSKYAVLAYEKTFSDVASTHWAYADIRSLAAKHILSGLTEQKFGPAAQTTRAEFAAFLARALGLKAKQPAPFRDVQQGQWYASDVAAAYEAGLIAGRSGNEFAPNAPITRQEMAVMLVHAFEKDGGKPSPQPDKDVSFKDGKDMASWAKPFIDRAANAGLMAGDVNGKFAPKRYTTRAEAAKAISNLLKQQ